jgi:hypothetical protein
LWRDDFHRDVVLARNGANVSGKWIASGLAVDGVVTNFKRWILNSSSLPGTAGTELENYLWWNAGGNDVSG